MVQPDTDPQASCAGLAAEPGSSINSSASDAALVIMRLVMVEFNVTVMLDCGMFCPAGVREPPVQVRTRSPTNSAEPSPRINAGAEVALQPKLAARDTPHAPKIARQ